MADIESAIEQDAIATSLLSDSDQQGLATEQGGFDRSLAGVIDRGDEETQEYGAEFEDQGESDLEGDDREQVNWALRAEKELILQEQEGLQQQEQEPEQYEPTAQDVQAGIQQLDQVVNELGLNDPGEAAALATDLGLPANSAAPLGSALAKVAVSATEVWEQCAGDLRNMPAIPHESAVAFTNDLLRSMGVDPRTTEVNPERLSATVLVGACNLLSAVERYGLGAGMDQLNSPDGAMWFANNFLQCLGGGTCQSLDGALQFADSCGRFFLSAWSKLAAQQEQQPPQGQGARSSGRSQRSSHSRFQSNSDLFDDESESLWRREHGRL